MDNLSQKITIIEMQIDSILEAKREVSVLCDKAGIDYFKRRNSKKYLEICKKVLAKWRTVEKYKVGDKVYVHPTSFSTHDNCIRATVIEVGTDGHGYRLQAFKQDLPGIWMFNIFDRQLEPRTNKKNKPIDPKLSIYSED